MVPSAPTARLRWGILATGNIARRFASDLRESRTGVLAAVGSRTTEAAAEFARGHAGVRAHGSYADLVADPGVDAVYVANPHPGHLEWTLRAVAAGKHVLCEKPIALRLADARRMVEAARAARVLLMEAFMYRCHPQTRRVAALVAEGAVGRLRTIRATFNFARPVDPAHRLFARDLGGGGILDIGCYPVSYARLVAGAALGRPWAEPEAFHGVAHRRAETGTDDYAAAVAVFPGGIVAELSCGTTVRREIAVRLDGEAGAIEVASPYHPGGAEPGGITLRRAGRPEEFIPPEPGPGLFAREADEVGDAVAAGAPETAAMPHGDTLGNMAVLERWLEQAGVRYD
jgi:predicted dehydrogenase